MRRRSRGLYVLVIVSGRRIIMRHVSLGNLDLSRIGLGTMGMSAYYTGAGSDEAETVRTIHRSLALGIYFVATAKAYGPCINERQAGRGGWPGGGASGNRILPRDTRPRGRNSPVGAALGDRLRRLLAAWPRFSHRSDPHGPTGRRRLPRQQSSIR